MALDDLQIEFAKGALAKVLESDFGVNLPMAECTLIGGGIYAHLKNLFTPQFKVCCLYVTKKNGLVEPFAVRAFIYPRSYLN